jgi:CHRD domain-containing protein
MRKIFTTLGVVAIVGATALAIAALAGATSGTGHGNRGHAGAPGEGHGKSRAHANKANRILFARLNGRNEIGPDGRRGAGDPDGRGGFTALVANNEVCFGLTVDNLDEPAAAAHIHRGKRRENGPIVVTLTAPLPGDPGTSSDCVPPDGGNPAVLQEILKHSNRFYVNVHTGAFPNGAIRGQLRHRRP